MSLKIDLKKKSTKKIIKKKSKHVVVKRSTSLVGGVDFVLVVVKNALEKSETELQSDLKEALRSREFHSHFVNIPFAYRSSVFQVTSPVKGVARVCEVARSFPWSKKSLEEGQTPGFRTAFKYKDRVAFELKK
jgi:hypothetical protein